MSADVERVARALCKTHYGLGETKLCLAYLEEHWPLWVPQAYAAMRETRLIDAEAWQHLADYDKDPIAKAVADWLTARAQETTDAKC